MTNEELKSLRAWFQRYLDRFRNGAGILPPMLELKRCHSIRVAENARRIAAALNAPEPERLLAEGTGLVHDVGRFNQFVRYGSFRDADTVDHGVEGRRVLEKEADSFPCDYRERELVMCAVEYHNRYYKDIPPDLSVEKDRLLRLVRDADKLDIMDLVLEAVALNGFRDLPTMLPHVKLSRNVSPDVLKEARTTKSVSSRKVFTTGDVLVMMATWLCDLNYQPALHLAAEREVLPRIRQELPETTSLNEIFEEIADGMRKAKSTSSNDSPFGATECMH